jgi:AcrR family transcriptional regulator
MTEPRPSKRERTRRQLIDAGLRVIAERGEALTASDVVTAADVSNGTFYNHFLDRDDFIQTLAHESLKAMTEGSADDTEGADPAWRFAVATARVLDAAIRQPLWGRAVLRLTECPTPMHAAVQQHLRSDLAEGHRTGRFTHGDDPITVDLVSGTVMASIRRLVSIDAPLDDTGRDAIPHVVARLLGAIGVDGDEARSLAAAAHRAERTPSKRDSITA